MSELKPDKQCGQGYVHERAHPNNLLGCGLINTPPEGHTPDYFATSDEYSEPYNEQADYCQSGLGIECEHATVKKTEGSGCTQPRA